MKKGYVYEKIKVRRDFKRKHLEQNFDQDFYNWHKGQKIKVIQIKTSKFILSAFIAYCVATIKFWRLPCKIFLLIRQIIPHRT